MKPLRVADSFRVRVRNGRAEARGFAHHLERFASSVRAARPTVEGLDAFLARACREIAAYGEGNPRLELRHDGSLALLLRPLPELRETIELRSSRAQGFAHPERKGPNIARFAELNRGLGAEALLLDASGRAIEGTTTAILWWRDETLCFAASGARVASVTERIVLAAAEAEGTPTAAGEATPGELASHEVWAVNALHGIRPALHVDGAELPEVASARLRRFRAALDRSWESVLADGARRS